MITCIFYSLHIEHKVIPSGSIETIYDKKPCESSKRLPDNYKLSSYYENVNEKLRAVVGISDGEENVKVKKCEIDLSYRSSFLKQVN